MEIKNSPGWKLANSTNLIVIGIIILGILNAEFSELVIVGLLGFLKNNE